MAVTVYSGVFASNTDDPFISTYTTGTLAPVDPSRTLVMCTSRVAEGNKQAGLLLTDSGLFIKAEWYQIGTANDAYVEWFAIVKDTWTVYSGVAATQGGGTSYTTVDVTLPEAVDTSKSWPVFTTRWKPAAMTGIFPWTARLTSSTNLRFERAIAPGSPLATDPQLYWQVVYDPDCTVQELDSGAVSATSVNQTIPSTDSTKTALFCSWRDSSATLGANKVYTTKQDSDTNIVRTRGTIFGSIGAHIVHAVTWSDGTTVTSFERTPSNVLSEAIAISAVDTSATSLVSTGYPFAALAKTGSSTTNWTFNMWSKSFGSSTQIDNEALVNPGLTSAIVDRFQMIEYPVPASGGINSGWFYA